MVARRLSENCLLLCPNFTFLLSTRSHPHLVTRPFNLLVRVLHRTCISPAIPFSMKLTFNPDFMNTGVLFLADCPTYLSHMELDWHVDKPSSDDMKARKSVIWIFCTWCVHFLQQKLPSICSLRCCLGKMMLGQEDTFIFSFISLFDDTMVSLNIFGVVSGGLLGTESWVVELYKFNCL